MCALGSRVDLLPGDRAELRDDRIDLKTRLLFDHGDGCADVFFRGLDTDSRKAGIQIPGPPGPVRERAR